MTTSDLEARADEGMAAHPELGCERADFLRHVADVIGDGAAPEAPRFGELYLAYAAGTGEPAAVQRLRDTFEGDVDHALRKAASTGQPIEELRQRVWVKLLAGDPPHIHRYAGRGSLQGWIRVVVSRMVVDLLRSHGARKETAFAPAVLAELGRIEPDPQLELLRQRYRDEVHAAMEHAFTQLDDKDRRLLRGQLIERLSTDDLGALYGVHRTTAARWTDQARTRLLRTAHEDLQRRVGGGEQTVRSLVELVRSHLDLSVSRLLASKQD